MICKICYKNTWALCTARYRNKTHHGSSRTAADIRCRSEHVTGRIKHLERRRFEIQMNSSNCDSPDNDLMSHDQRLQSKTNTPTAAENAKDQILHTRAQSRGFLSYWDFVESRTTHALEYAARTDWLYDECRGFAGFSDMA
jgi:hypothetical protein